MSVLWLDSLEPNQLSISLSLYTQLSMPNKITVHFGSFHTGLKVVVNLDQADETLGLPVELSTRYTIPKELPYEWHIKNNEIYLGPVIAYCVRGKFEKLTKKKLAILLPRFHEYQAIGGVIFICTRDSIHIDKRIIEGYYYDPSEDTPGSRWKYGKFPLPNAVFNRSKMSQRKIKLLKKSIGNTIFNSYFENLNKWLIWKNLSKNKEIRNHLPYTEKYKSADQIIGLVKDYGTLYIKPFELSQGRGILQVSKVNERFRLIDPAGQSYLVRGKRRFKRLLKEKVVNSSIIQQAVPYKLGDRLVDFRIYLQKDDTNRWSFQGSEGRVSKQGSIITNTRGRDKNVTGNEVLRTLFGLTSEKATFVEEAMAKLVESAVEVYQRKGIHIGDVAADVILDDHLHIWLLELQLNYGLEKYAYEMPPDLFTRLMITPFRYAKAMAGFHNNK